MSIRDLLGALQIGQKESGHVQLWTSWGEEVHQAAADNNYVPLPEHPTPQLQRDCWKNLNGWWRCWFEAGGNLPETISSERESRPILVPFSPESALSGICRQLKPGERLWYSRSVKLGEPGNKRLLLHFGAVDQHCRVFWNGQKVGDHLGGYLSFTLDITDYAVCGQNTLCVCCLDQSDTGYHSRGKQTLNPKGMYYTAQSGIWQTVWLEWVPTQYVQNLCLRPDTDNNCLYLQLALSCPQDTAVKVDVIVENQIAASTQGIISQSASQLKISIPGCRLWSPENPFLYYLRIYAGEDSIRSYAAMRTFTVEKDNTGVSRFCINHQPYYFRGVLDQGYWPDGLYTAPTDEALKHDIVQLKRLGFRLLRKHCKLEPMRWYYHCDYTGMLVWQDMVNGGTVYNPLQVCYLPTIFPILKTKLGWNAKACGRYKNIGCQQWYAETEATIQQLYNAPSLCGWVVFNEGWGQFSTKEATDFVRQLDSSRPIDSASGWFDFGCGDYRSEHNYFFRLKLPRDKKHRAVVISEFGGLTLGIKGHTFSEKVYGYHTIDNPDEYRLQVQKLLQEVDSLSKDGLSGSVFTQVSDIEEEINGIFTYDRKICKLDALQKS